jgi:hypothetical protein
MQINLRPTSAEEQLSTIILVASEKKPRGTHKMPRLIFVDFFLIDQSHAAVYSSLVAFIPEAAN